jgi:CDP-4-dehydro-6-deoxyglucose reductase, E1
VRMESSLTPLRPANKPGSDGAWAEYSSALKEIVEVLISDERAARTVNDRYWYPLSRATYGSEEILEALESMCSFRTSMSEKTRTFERMFSAYQGCLDAVMVNSGSSADLLLGLLLTDPLRPMVRSGDEVLVPIVTWPTQIWSMMMAGLSVKLVDVDPRTMNVDLDDLESSISERSRAIFVVHLLGNPCNMDRITEIARRHELYIIEDCCEAMGSSWGGKQVGNFGIGGSFSFFFSHHITTMEGGMVVVNDEDAAERLRILRAHGWIRNVIGSRYHPRDCADIDSRYAFVDWGVNVRPTEVQAGFGIHQLEKVDAFASRRMQLSSRFRKFLSEETDTLVVPHVDAKASPSWLAFPLMVQPTAPFTREQITVYLEAAGVETRPIVAGNLARHPVGERFAEFRRRSFDGADQIHTRGFYIGASPMIEDAKLDRLMAVFREFLARY